MRGISSVGPLVAVASCLFVGCGGGGGGGESPVDTVLNGKVAFGFIENANVSVYDYDDLTTPIGTTTSSTGASVDAVGNFSLAVPGVLSSDVFLVVVTGGTARDVDENDVLDGGPLANAGVAHAVVRGEELRAGGIVRVSTVSECVYQRTRFLFAGHYPETFVRQSADAWATFVLHDSLDGDGDVDAGDAVRFDPRFDRSALYRPYAPFSLLVSDVLAGVRATPRAFAIADDTLYNVDSVGNGRGAEIVGHRAYIGEGNVGIHIYDVTDPSAPALLGTYAAGSIATQRLRVVGDILYASDLGFGLLVIDVSDPTAPTLLGSLPIPGGGYGMEIRGTRAYLLNGNALDPEFHVIDISDPTNPVNLATVIPSSYGASCGSDGTWAYTSSSFGGVEIFRVRPPGMTHSVGFIETQGSARQVAVRDGVVYAATTFGLELFDILGPNGSNPVPLGSVPLVGDFPEGIAFHGDDVLVSLSFDGVAVVDCHDPNSPKLRGVIAVPSTTHVIACDGDLAVSDDSNGGFHVMAAGRPAPSPAIASIAVPNVECVRMDGAIAYVGSGFLPGALRTYDLTNPAAPVLLATVGVPSMVQDVRVRAGLAYLGTERDGLHIFDVSNPAAPFFVGSTPTPENVRALTLGSDVAWAAASSDGLATIDVSAPSAPAVLGTLATPQSATCIAYDGVNGLLVGASFTGVRSYDVTTQTAPAFRGNIGSPVIANDVLAIPNRGFVARFSGSGIGNAFDVLDTAPATPTLLISRPVPQLATQLDRAGSDVFQGGRATGVHVLDVADPALPVLWGRVPTDHSAVDVATSTTVLLVSGDSTVSVFAPAVRAVP